MAAVIRSSVVWAGCAAFAFLAGCGPGRPEPVHSDVLAKAGLQYYWQLPLGLARREHLVRLERIDENLYCLTDRHRLIAIDAASGRLKWSADIGGPGTTVFQPTHADGVRLSQQVAGIKEILSPGRAGKLGPFDVVMVNTLSYVLVFDRRTGEVYRKIPFDFAANAGGASDGEFFYVGSTKGWYFAIRVNEAVKAWWLSAADMMTAPLKYYAGRLYLADDSGQVIATAVGEQGRKVWSQKLPAPVTAEFHVDGRGCFVPCDDNRLYAFGLRAGRPLWDRPFVCQGPLRDAVQVAARTIFQFARRDKFYAINLANGKERWSRPDGRKVLAVMDGEVFLLNSSNTLLIVDEMLGTVRASMPLTGWELFAANTAMPAVYAATRDGRLACIRKVEAGYLKPEMLRQRP